PLLDEGCFGAVPPVGPGHRFPIKELLEFLLLLVDAQTDERERLVLQLRHHLPLVRDHGLARPAPRGPDVEHNDLALVVGEAHLLTVEVLAFGRWGLHADLQVAQLDQAPLGPFPERPLPTGLDVGEVLLDAGEIRLRLFGSILTVLLEGHGPKSVAREPFEFLGRVFLENRYKYWPRSVRRAAHGSHLDEPADLVGLYEVVVQRLEDFFIF